MIGPVIDTLLFLLLMALVLPVSMVWFCTRGRHEDHDNHEVRRAH